MHRLHEDDLVGHVLAQEDWEVVRSAEIREDDETPPLDAELRRLRFTLRRQGRPGSCARFSTPPLDQLDPATFDKVELIQYVRKLCRFYVAVRLAIGMTTIHSFVNDKYNYRFSEIFVGTAKLSYPVRGWVAWGGLPPPLPAGLGQIFFQVWTPSHMSTDTLRYFPQDGRIGGSSGKCRLNPAALV